MKHGYRNAQKQEKIITSVEKKHKTWEENSEKNPRKTPKVTQKNILPRD